MFKGRAWARSRARARARSGLGLGLGLKKECHSLGSTRHIVYVTVFGRKKQVSEKINYRVRAVIVVRAQRR